MTKAPKFKPIKSGSLAEKISAQLNTRGEMTISDLSLRLKVRRSTVDCELRRNARFSISETLYGVSIWGLA